MQQTRERLSSEEITALMSALTTTTRPAARRAPGRLRAAAARWLHALADALRGG